MMRLLSVLSLLLPLSASAQWNCSYVSTRIDEDQQRLTFFADGEFDYLGVQPPESDCIITGPDYGLGHYTISGDTLALYFEDEKRTNSANHIEIDTLPPISTTLCRARFSIIPLDRSGTESLPSLNVWSNGPNAPRAMVSYGRADSMELWRPYHYRTLHFELGRIALEPRDFDLRFDYDIRIRCIVTNWGQHIMPGTVRKYLIRHPDSRHPLLRPISAGEHTSYKRK